MERDYADMIAKLLLKAESTTPEEAELLYGKAQELMTKYAIDEAMIAAARAGTQDNPIVREEFVDVGIYLYPLSKLTTYVLINNDIQCARLAGTANWREVGGRIFKTTQVVLGVGYKSDLDRARLLATSLKLQAMTAEGIWWRENEALYEGAKRGGHYHRRQFLSSFADGVGVKLATATARGRAAAEEEHGSDSVALVLRDKSIAVQDAFDEMFPELRPDKRKLKGGDAYAASHGFEAGTQADVGQPVVEKTEEEKSKEIDRG